MPTNLKVEYSSIEMNIVQGHELSVDSSMTVWKYILMKISHFGDKVAQIDAETKRTVTFAELLSFSESVTSCLKAHGILTGDVVAICSENNIEYCWILLGVLSSGASCVLLNPTYTQRELEHAVGISRPKIVLCSALVARENPDGIPPIAEVFSRTETIQDVLVWGSGDTILPFQCRKLEEALEMPVGVDDQLTPKHSQSQTDTAVHEQRGKVACILSSSGSTGLPKGVMLSHSNIVAALATSGDYTNIEEVALGLMPFFHAYGLLLMLMCLCEGARVVVMRKFAVNAFVSTIQEHKITSLYLVPSLLVLVSKHEALINADFSNMHHIWTGAAPVSATLQEMVHQKLGKCGALHHSYGLTETTFTMLTGTYRQDKPGSPGKLTPGMECKVIDTTTGNILGPNEKGELCFRGPLLMIGYMRNLEATAETIDSDGWLHTGDLGYYDEDLYFFIVDRLKELIKYQGYQVSPSELESILLTHLAIQDAAVVGLPDEVYGELPQAFVVKQPGVEVSVEEIMDFVANEVSPHKRLYGGVKFVDSIPKTVSGKIQRRQLRKLDTIE